VQGGLCGGRLLLRLIESHGWCGSCTSPVACPEPPAANAGGSFLGPFDAKRTNHTTHIKGYKTLSML
ncbi:uncharacterized protein METZ01_LOCUS73268, partial [marine metagenome]